jgi:hypothetical protein
MKICRKCKIEKEESEFGKDNRGADGFRPRCKECRNVDEKKYSTKKKAYDQKRYTELKDVILENNRHRWHEKKSVYSVANRQWAKQNPTKQLERKRRYNNKNRNLVRHRGLAAKRKEIETLGNNYIKGQLRKAGIPTKISNSLPMLIELQRSIYRNKRVLKQLLKSDKQ